MATKSTKSAKNGKIKEFVPAPAPQPNPKTDEETLHLEPIPVNLNPPDAEIPPQPKPVLETRSAPPVSDEKTAEPTFTREQVEEMIAAAVKKATEGASRRSDDDMVTMLYLAEVSPDDTLILPGYGSLRPHGYLQVPKREFGSKFMSTLARKLIDRRFLIVVSGLDEEEQERWNCRYKPGEILSEKVFDKMLQMPIDELCEIFRHLCREHRQFIVTRFITAAERKDNRVSLDKAVALNKISMEDGEDLFRPIIEAYKAEM